ncbi:MAG: hypothetical protein M3355_11900 [Actinomycetota bacterium]|nr:hypothetical protein [Actinomycetota bacterium]
MTTTPFPTLRRKHAACVTIPMVTRMRALAGANLSLAAIVAVIELDYGVRVAETTVRRYVRRGAPFAKRAGVVGMSHDNGANLP